MTNAPQTQPADGVLAAWAPAGMGKIVVLVDRGVVIHKAVVSGKAGAKKLPGAAGGALGGAIGGVAAGASVKHNPNRHFIEKVLRNGVDGLLASKRAKVIPWDSITGVEHQQKKLGRGKLVIKTTSGDHKLKFLMETHVEGDPQSVFKQRLGDRYTTG